MRTSLYSILCIVIRLGAVLLFVNTLLNLPAVWLSANQGGWGSATENGLIGFAVAQVALSIALWLYPELLAKLAVNQASQQVFESPISARQLQYIALAVLGVAIAMNGLMDLLRVGMRLVLTFDQRVAAFDMRRDAWAAVVLQVVHIALGVGLALGARGLVGLLHRLRERSLPPAYVAEEADAASADPGEHDAAAPR